MIILLKKHLKRELFFKERKLNRFVLGKANLKDSFARIESGEVYLHNMHISPYEQGNRYNHDPLVQESCCCIARKLIN